MELTVECELTKGGRLMGCRRWEMLIYTYLELIRSDIETDNAYVELSNICIYIRKKFWKEKENGLCYKVDSRIMSNLKIYMCMYTDMSETQVIIKN